MLRPEIVVGREALEELVRYAAARPAGPWTLIADTNTHAALGERVERLLRGAGLEVAAVVLQGPAGLELVADDVTLVRALTATQPGPQVYVAVGSGTITDIARFAAYRTGNAFISVPTAASMDGYATSNNTLTLNRLKVSLPGKTPEAIFCDTATLARAPRAMTAAGLGDNLARFTSVNDLRLGHMLWGERWDRAIGDRMEAMGQVGLRRAREIAAGGEDAIAELTRALLDSGLAMGDFGNSAPGAGSEHHISHCWEMRLQQRGEPAHLHGAKVGVGSVMAARWYAEIAEMTEREAANRLAAAKWPDVGEEIEAIRRVYGPVAEQIIEAQRPFLFLTEAQFGALKARILDTWHEIRGIAARVPQPGRLAEALRIAGGPASGAELGLPADEVEIAARYGMYTRPRFTVARLRVVLGI